MTIYSGFKQMIALLHNRRSVLFSLSLPLLLGQHSVRGETFTIDTPGGPVQIELSHVDPGGSLVTPSEPQTPGFRPPAIFSAPLPSGSGARALGLSGAFTAVADDATAASWNPAGLIQLERAEASFVYRFSSESHGHTSSDENYRVGNDDFSTYALNYLSAVLPFRLRDRNLVFSANYQEAYDFEQSFHAGSLSHSSGSASQSSSAIYEGIQHDQTNTPTMSINITSYITTHKMSSVNQLFSSGAVTDLRFEQHGVIDALSPALAVEITPSFALGIAVNVYQDDLFGQAPIRSHTRASYDANSISATMTEDVLVSTGSYEADGVLYFEGGGGLPPVEIPFEMEGEYETPFSQTNTTAGTQGLQARGVYDEYNDFDSLRGINATIGALWSVSRHLGLGFGVDLPWTAEATQTRTVRNTVSTYDATGTRLLDSSSSERVERKDVEFEFPLYWALGAVWRWNNRFHTSLDLSQTWWSDFSFQAEGEEKLNPLDGTPHAEGTVDDCWSARLGAEYLCVLKRTEIPLRGGIRWEQRPAVGEPDEYWGLSLGSGISLGKEPGRLILDVAYTYSWGDHVLGTLVPDQEGLGTDVNRHDLHLSCIWHF